MTINITFKLREEIDFNNINWDGLAGNCNSIELLENNLDKITDLEALSNNPSAIELLKKNPNKIDWSYLSLNPNAIDLLKSNPDKLYWCNLNLNLNAIDLLIDNPDKISWDLLSHNPSIFEIDYEYLKSLMSIHFEEICIKVFHPKNEGKLWSIYEYF